MYEENDRIVPCWTYIAKGIAIGLFALIIKLISSLACVAVYSQNGPVDDLPDFIADIAIFVASIFIYNSIFSLFLSFDKSASKEYLDSIRKSEAETSELKSIFTKSFIAECVPILLILSIAAACGGSWEIFGMFHTPEGRSPYASGILPFLVNLALIALFLIYERYEAVRYWKMLKKQSNLDEISSKSKIIVRLILVFTYPLTLPYLPFLGYILFTSVNIITILFAAPILLLTVILLIAAFLGIKLLFSMKNRKNFFNRLKTLARQHSFELSEITNPYSSLFSRKKQCNFTIKTKQGSFDCLVIGNVRRGVPICFTSGKEGYYRYRLGTPKHNITMQRHFEFSAPGENRKIMIINPTPKFAYICDPECKKEKRLYNSDKLWDFVVYEAEAFLGATDRGSLGKFSSVAENSDVVVPGRPMRRI